MLSIIVDCVLEAEEGEDVVPGEISGAYDTAREVG